MSSRVLLRTSADVLRKSYLKGAVGTPQRTALDAGGPSMLYRGQFEPSLEINYVDDPRLAVGETFTRATIRTTRGFEGRILTLNSGEVGFWGFRRVENLDTDQTEGNPAATAATGTSPPTIQKNVVWAGRPCVSIRFASGVAARADASAQIGAVQVLLNAIFAQSCDVALSRELTGNEAIQIKLDGARGVSPAIAINASNTSRGWVSRSATSTAIASTGADTWFVEPTAALTSELTVYITHRQVENVTGQSYQGASEYVSRGILPAPYHGANVDGVKYFATGFNGALIKRYTGDTIKYLQLAHVNTVGAGQASTPDSAAVSITGDIDVDVYCAPHTWAPVATPMLLNKLPTAAGQRSYDFWHSGGGGRTATLRISVDGTALSTAVSSALPFANGEGGYVRAVRIANSGEVRFYWSRDGRQWTAAGTAATTPGAIFDGTAPLIVGSQGSGNANSGVFYRARVYRGVRDQGGVLVAEFNANDAAAAGSASLVSSTTGETWTIASNGVEARINTFTKTGRRGFFREPASTNLQIRSDALDNATYTKTRTTVTADAIVGVDGSLIGDRLVEDATAASTHIVQNTALVKAASALPYTLTYYLRAGERSAARADLFSGANGAFARFNLLDGTVLTAGTLVGAGFATPSAAIEQVAPGVYACSLTVTSDATAALQSQLGLYNAADAYNGDAASGLYVLAQQIEQLDHATSYIPTAAAGVTRDADICHVATASSWFNALAFTLSAEAMVAPAATAVGSQVLASTTNAGAFGAGPSVLLRRTTATLATAGGNGTAANVAATLATAPFIMRGRFEVATTKQSIAATGAVGVTSDATLDYTGVSANRLQIGSLNAAGAQPFEGFLGRLYVHPFALADARMGVVSSLY